MTHHTNDRQCKRCLELLEAYPGFYQPLREWFTGMQGVHPEMHLSCAGRGRAAQEAAVSSGASRAHYGDSAHNANAAIDIFVQLHLTNPYDEEWFAQVLANNIPLWLEWYGVPGSEFFELPHLQLKTWREELAAGNLKLVDGEK